MQCTKHQQRVLSGNRGIEITRAFRTRAVRSSYVVAFTMVLAERFPSVATVALGTEILASALCSWVCKLGDCRGLSES